jgi:ubiquinone/menaquinone biosynthesis C-methylase UbiE
MSWEGSDDWYGSIVGEKGHYYHQHVILPKLLPFVGMKRGAWLDVGCGNGVLARHLPKTFDYLGIDASKGLIAEAKKLTLGREFLVEDAACFQTEKEFDCVVFILSFQNMKEGEKVIEMASRVLKKDGKVVIVMNHPCFRIPRQSSWGEDAATKLQFRKVYSYMSDLAIPIATHPGRKDSQQTISYHHSLSTYSSWLYQHGLSIEKIEEWCSDKKSTGVKAKMEDRARREIPLFLAMLAKK